MKLENKYLLNGFRNVVKYLTIFLIFWQFWEGRGKIFSRGEAAPPLGYATVNIHSILIEVEVLTQCGGQVTQSLCLYGARGPGEIWRKTLADTALIATHQWLFGWPETLGDCAKVVKEMI